MDTAQGMPVGVEVDVGVVGDVAVGAAEIPDRTSGGWYSDIPSLLGSRPAPWPSASAALIGSCGLE
jgi:hypothetical protein